MKKKILHKDINIDRVDKIISSHLKKKQKYKLYPMLSSIEFSINGACNRRCFFCPREDEKNYPNIIKSIPLNIFKELVLHLKENNYEGRLSFSGFCEPLLTKNIFDYIEIISKNLNGPIEMVSNGDVLLSKNGEEKLVKLYESGLTNLKLSLYDGEHQVVEFLKIKKKLKLSDEQLILRKRYLGPEESHGLTISNRAGSVSMKNEYFELKPLDEPLKQPCYYPFYKVLIDYDGSVLMCSNDWKKENIIGNINKENLLDIWIKKNFLDVRSKLLNSDRNHKPCDVCDVNGTLNGKKSFDEWKTCLSKQTKNF